jgi:serine protease
MNYWKIGLAVLVASVVQVASAAEYTDRLIVKLRAPTVSAQMHSIMSASQESTLRNIAGIQLSRVRVMSDGGQVMQLPQAMTVAEAQVVASKLQSDPSVEYAEPDQIRRPMLTPTDPSFGVQWNLNSSYGINAPAAWNTTTGSASIVVAVLDTGMAAHAELSGRSVAGYDFISNVFVANDGDVRDADPSDPGDWVAAGEVNTPPCTGGVAENSSWHGTAIAGAIGAIANNGVGIAGINWASKILPVRVMGKCGGYVSDIVDGMRWAAGLTVHGVPANANPAKVLNLSLGSSGTCSAAEQSAIDEIVALNKVVVVAAGNDSSIVSAPANCSGVIAVAATTQLGSLTSISNSGGLVAISAPGGESNYGIYLLSNTGTTVPVSDSYGGYYGTSISAAEVSGVVSLMFSVNSQLSPAQVKSILQSTATAFPNNSTCTTSICGAGIVNAASAVSLASTTSGVPVSPASSGGGGGGGGCALSLAATFDPLLACLAAVALAGLCWRRIRRQ